MSVSENTDAMDRLIDGIDCLRSSPSVAQRILSLTRDPNFKMKDVVACLERDPALATRILRVVNSSLYGLGRQISSVRHAATYLGQKSLRMFAVTFSLVDTLTKGVHKTLASDYWPRALAMATVAGHLSKRLDGVEENDAYTAGLLADVGVLALAQAAADEYCPAYVENRHGPALINAEQQLFGFAHPEFGARLLEKWDLPEHMVIAVGDHHSKGSNPQPLSRCVVAGNLMGDALIAPAPIKLDLLREFLRSVFGANDADLAALAESCRADMKESASIFGDSAYPEESSAEFLDMVLAAQPC